MEHIEVFRRLGVALAIGLLVGVERGWTERDVRVGGRTAGLRTFGLTGFLGGIVGTLQPLTGPFFPATIAVLLGVVYIAGKWQEAIEDKDYGITSIIAALCVFALGMLATLGDLITAGAGAVVVTVVLAARTSLHGFLQGLTWVELRSALMLLAMTVIALPLLPDKPLDPWGALNPYALWLLTITIAALSFAGYVAIRLMGSSRGILLAGAAGGLVSSTALTLSFARYSMEAPQGARHLAAGAAIAGALSFARVLVIASALSLSMLAPLSSALIPAIIGFLATSLFLAWRSGSSTQAPEIGLTNPFELKTVISFALLLGLISLVSKMATEYVGASALYVVAAISGLVDVDAITLSTVRLVGSAISATTAADVTLIAVFVNMVTKVALAFTAGRREYAVTLGLASAVAILFGAIGYLSTRGIWAV
ncbi:MULTISPECIES: MgtC/SapB family protein [unclassified Rhizobium]|uniref:MgtC/SapB family protein n=1 Tax=unclassified Rhizobium TaxID=2613769 RepID=UPI001ADB4E38|nr:MULTISPECIES: MgtC/SapB family protein [unclassified Rhizobium]MBO9122532.1 MgtC/SapB family protein [Rhizobium sp. 16-488-2b]MBO9173063.1 MgtC/SapB family protein [Rhizobium sp. 16-488-2a]